jgi:hypothetical protein
MKIDQAFFDRLNNIVSELKIKTHQNSERNNYILENQRYIQKEREEFFSTEVKIGLWGCR